MKWSGLESPADSTVSWKLGVRARRTCPTPIFQSITTSSSVTHFSEMLARRDPDTGFTRGVVGAGCKIQMPGIAGGVESAWNGGNGIVVSFLAHELWLKLTNTIS